MAQILDFVIVYLPLTILAFAPWVVYMATRPPEFFTDDSNVLPAVAFLFAAWAGLFVVQFLYRWLSLAKWGATLGKRLMGIKVIAAPPRIGRASAGTMAAREGLTMLVGVVAGVLIIADYIWCLVDKPLQQCLHDKVAGTIVVKARLPAGGSLQ